MLCALVLAKFANEILVKMNDTMRSLVDTLGEDTMALTLRVGLHSGPITAGVLRGENCRFQVFRDTVNTGSRMESLGEGNRIHVSPTTAELIRNKHQKGHWLLKRPDLVTPKGKEPIQTYWLIPDRAASSHASILFASTVSNTSVPVSKAQQAMVEIEQEGVNLEDEAPEEQEGDEGEQMIHI